MEGNIRNHQSSAIVFHPVPWRSTWIQAGRGTGTANLEAKLFQQVIAMREAVLHVIFLDL